mgnify:CR=1 FL=1
MKLEVVYGRRPVLTGLTELHDSQNFLRRDLCACILILKFWNLVNPVQISVEERCSWKWQVSQCLFELD